MPPSDLGRHHTAASDPISLEILWSRMISIADEAAATLVRTAFSTIVYETHDYTCMLLDLNGDSIAQSSRCAPSFIGTLPATTKHFIKWFPPETLEPGDMLLTNDPWMGTGHTPDMNVLMPIFLRGRLVGYAASEVQSDFLGERVAAVWKLVFALVLVVVEVICFAVSKFQ